MKYEQFYSVWYALCDTPGEAANVQAKAKLMRKTAYVLKK